MHKSAPSIIIVFLPEIARSFPQFLFMQSRSLKLFFLLRRRDHRGGPFMASFWPLFVLNAKVGLRF